MVKGKRIRDKGKIKLSRYFKKISDGTSVSVVADKGIAASFPKRISGKSGVVEGSRGNYKLVKLKDGAKLKTYIIHPAHLKEIK